MIITILGNIISILDKIITILDKILKIKLNKIYFFRRKVKIIKNKNMIVIIMRNK
jgi:hypothetical protein